MWNFLINYKIHISLAVITILIWIFLAETKALARWYLCSNIVNRKSETIWMHPLENRAPQVTEWSRSHLPVQQTQETQVAPGSGGAHGAGNANTSQYSCLGNSMGREAWPVHGVTKSWTWLSDWTHTHTHTHWQTAKQIKIHSYEDICFHFVMS